MELETLEKQQDRIDLREIKRKRINLAIFGHGKVGSQLIAQIISSKEEILRRRDLDLNVFAIANSSSVLLKNDDINASWLEEKEKNGLPYTLEEVINYAKAHALENLIAVDNTASSKFVTHYTRLIDQGFHLVSSNKIGNTQSLDFYQTLRKTLAKNDKEYLYETNVGAGLPLIDTIKLLHLSGENITRIKGVFSGSLSYIFNSFSESDHTFGTVLQAAVRNGYTEPDPREDLSGNDVARKLLILARELDLHNEFEDISIHNLIPKALRNVSKEVFLNSINDLNVPYHIQKKKQQQGYVLRYVADLHGDLSKVDGAMMDVKLTSVPKNTVLGQLKGSDSLFEIYTQNYGEHPIVIQGAGAGAQVTARGVFGDILRLCDKVN